MSVCNYITTEGCRSQGEREVEREGGKEEGEWESHTLSVEEIMALIF